MRRPVPTPTSTPFWQAAAEGALSYPRCAGCETWFTYLRPWCPRCLRQPLGLARVSGLGRVYSSTTVHRPPAASFAELVPYAFSLIDLDEGVRTVSMVIGCSPESVAPGMRVRADVQLPSDDDRGETPLIFFRPA